MKDTTTPPGDTAEIKPPAETVPPELKVTVKVLINGALIEGCHHSKDKQFDLPASKAEFCANQVPPTVEILGPA